MPKPGAAAPALPVAAGILHGLLRECPAVVSGRHAHRCAQDPASHATPACAVVLPRG